MRPTIPRSPLLTRGHNTELKHTPPFNSNKRREVQKLGSASQWSSNVLPPALHNRSNSVIGQNLFDPSNNNSIRDDYQQLYLTATQKSGKIGFDRSGKPAGRHPGHLVSSASSKRIGPPNLDS